MTISPLAKKALVVFVMVCALPCVLADGVASVMPSDEEWRQIKERWLAKPRRVIVDDDGCDALNFPEKEKQTVENFYAQMLDSMVGNAFDVLMPGAVMAVVPIIIVYLFAQKTFIAGLTSGSVKG